MKLVIIFLLCVLILSCDFLQDSSTKEDTLIEVKKEYTEIENSTIENDQSSNEIENQEIESPIINPVYRLTSLLIEDESQWWFYNKLSDLEKKIYKEYLKIASNVCEGDAMEIELDFQAESSDVFDAYIALRQDHPELFWLPTSIQTNEVDGKRILLSPAARWSKKWTEEEFELNLKKFNEEANSFLIGFKEEWDVGTQLWFIMNNLQTKVVYQKGYSNVHSTDGAIVDKRAVCEGISMAYKHLVEKAGVKVDKIIQLTGQAKPYGKSQPEHHAWIAIQINGEWYFSDPTWMVIRHDWYNYFQINHNDFSIDHLSLTGVSKLFEEELKNNNSGEYSYENIEKNLPEDVLN